MAKYIHNLVCGKAWVSKLNLLVALSSTSDAYQRFERKYFIDTSVGILVQFS